MIFIKSFCHVIVCLLVLVISVQGAFHSTDADMDDSLSKGFQAQDTSNAHQIKSPANHSGYAVGHAKQNRFDDSTIDPASVKHVYYKHGRITALECTYGRRLDSVSVQYSLERCDRRMGGGIWITHGVPSKNTKNKQAIRFKPDEVITSVLLGLCGGSHAKGAVCWLDVGTNMNGDGQFCGNANAEGTRNGPLYKFDKKNRFSGFKGYYAQINYSIFYTFGFKRLEALVDRAELACPEISFLKLRRTR